MIPGRGMLSTKKETSTHGPRSMNGSVDNSLGKVRGLPPERLQTMSQRLRGTSSGLQTFSTSNSKLI